MTFQQQTDRRGFLTLAASLAGLSMGLPRDLLAHDDDSHVHIGDLTIHPLPTSIDLGFHRPAAEHGKNLTGHGALSAQLMMDLPVPADVSTAILTKAHGTVMVREHGPGKGDILWGLENYGLIEYRASEDYKVARKLPIDFPNSFNLHGAELFYPGPNEMIAAADNVGRRVFVANTAGGDVRVIKAPDTVAAEKWVPTDVTVYAPDLDAEEKGAYRLLITNGYGSPAVVYEFDLHADRYTRSMNVSFDGVSRTPHGISRDSVDSIVLSQREAHAIQQRVIGDDKDAASFGKLKKQFTIGSAVRPCDLDWNTFSKTRLGCISVLRGPGSNPGGVAICDNEGKIVSLININSDRPEIQHTHDAAFVPLIVDGEPAYGVVATSWNPGKAPTLYLFVDPTGYKK